MNSVIGDVSVVIYRNIPFEFPLGIIEIRLCIDE